MEKRSAEVALAELRARTAALEEREAAAKAELKVRFTGVDAWSRRHLLVTVGCCCLGVLFLGGKYSREPPCDTQRGPEWVLRLAGAKSENRVHTAVCTWEEH